MSGAAATARGNGVALALAAYTLWGLLPVYWKLLQAVPATEVLAHRVAWSVPFCALLAVAFGARGALRRLTGNVRELGVLALSAALIALNWGIYIWAVQAGRILEASLGYFLMPLLNVAAGRVLFGERLRPWQWLAVALAGAGVGNELLRLGVVPWVGLGLALTFVAYGVLRKRTLLDAANGLLVETALLAPAAVVYLLWLARGPGASFGNAGLPTDLLLILTGVVTALPLALHVAATRRLPLKDVGVLFYLTPSLSFLLGVYVYREPFGVVQLLSFACIWLALAVYTLEGRWQARAAGVSG